MNSTTPAPSNPSTIIPGRLARTFRRALKILALLATLIAIAWQVENWRGRHAWEAVLQEIEDNGQSVDRRSLIPDKAPDGLNTAKHPVFAEVYLNAPNLKPYGYFIDFGPLFDSLLDENPEDIGPLLNELGEAFDRPHCQWFHANETYPDGTLPIPQIADFTNKLTQISLLLHSRAAAHLDAGNSNAALRELGVLISFGRMMESGPLIVDQFITAATARIVAKDLESLIGHPSWTPANLTSLNNRIHGMKLLDGLWQSFHLERIFNFQLLLKFPQNGVQALAFAPGHQINRAIRSRVDRLPRSWCHHSLYQLGSMLDRATNMGVKRMPQGWLYQNLCGVYTYWEQHLLSPFDPAAQRVTPRSRQPIATC